MFFIWEDGFEIKTRVEDDKIIISANTPGLLSLANHLTTLANAPTNNHLHLDEYNSLEEGSTDLILERIS